MPRNAAKCRFGQWVDSSHTPRLLIEDRGGFAPASAKGGWWSSEPFTPDPIEDLSGA